VLYIFTEIGQKLNEKLFLQLHSLFMHITSKIFLEIRIWFWNTNIKADSVFYKLYDFNTGRSNKIFIGSE